MKNIRTFIVCSSLLLVAWLAASYSTELDHASKFSESVTSQATSKKPVAETSKAQKDMMAATASLGTN